MKTWDGGLDAGDVEPDADAAEDAVAEVAVASRPADARPGARRWLRLWPYVVVVVVALSASALHVARYTQLSPFDESRHVDYMARLYEDGHVVRLGDKLGDTAMRLEACRGVDVPGFVPPPCSTPRFLPRDFRDEGYDNAVNNPPLYYVVTGAVAELAKRVGLADSILDPARLMSGIWLAAGLVLALYAGELLGVGRVPLVAAAVLFALAPDALFMGATVNADAAALFAGALVLVGALLWERRRLRVGWLLAAGAIVAALKMTNLIGVGIVGAWLLAQACRTARPPEEPDGSEESPIPGRSPREYVVACGLLVAGAVAITVAWLAVAGARATVDALALPSNQQFYTPHFPWKTFIIRQNLFSLFPPLGVFRPPVLTTAMNETMAGVAGLLAAGVLVVGVLRYSVRDRIGALAGVAAAVLFVAGDLFIFSTWVVNRVIFQPVSRYGLSAFAVIIVVTAAAARGRVGTVVLSTAAVVMAATVLGTLVFA